MKKLIKIIFICFIMFVVLQGFLYLWVYLYKSKHIVLPDNQVIPKEIILNKGSVVKLFIQTPFMYDRCEVITDNNNDIILFKAGEKTKKRQLNAYNLWEIEGLLLGTEHGIESKFKLDVIFYSEKGNVIVKDIINTSFIVKAPNASSTINEEIEKKNLNKIDDYLFKKEILLQKKYTNIIYTIIIIIILIAIVLYFCFRKKPQIPFEDIALDALNKLDKNLDEKEFFSQLSDIIRIFITNKYSIPFIHQTSREFLYYIKDQQKFSELKENIEELLNIIDEIKFANILDNAISYNNAIDIGTKIVNTTIEEEVLEEEQNV